MAWACSVDSHLVVRSVLSMRASEQHPPSIRPPLIRMGPTGSKRGTAKQTFLRSWSLWWPRCGRRGERIGFEHDGRRFLLLLLPSFAALCGIAHSQKLFSSFNTLSIIYVAPPPPSPSVRESCSASRAERARSQTPTPPPPPKGRKGVCLRSARETPQPPPPPLQ